MPPGSPGGASYQLVDGDVDLDVEYHYWVQAVEAQGEPGLYGPEKILVQEVVIYNLWLPIVARQ